MSEHYCEYDHNLEEPCGKPAGLKWGWLWLCAEHYDHTMKMLERAGIDPLEPGFSREEIERIEKEAKRLAELPAKAITPKELDDL